MSSSRILVITAPDHAPMAPGLPEALRAQGHEVEEVAHGPDALLALATRPTQLVVADVRDFERDGVAFARIVRERPSFAQLPLIAVAELTLREQASLLVAGFDRVAPPECAEIAVPRAAADLFGTPFRVPSLLEAYARAVSLAFQPSPMAPTRVAMYQYN